MAPATCSGEKEKQHCKRPHKNVIKYMKRYCNYHNPQQQAKTPHNQYSMHLFANIQEFFVLKAVHNIKYLIKS